MKKSTCALVTFTALLLGVIIGFVCSESKDALFPPTWCLKRKMGKDQEKNEDAPKEDPENSEEDISF